MNAIESFQQQRIDQLRRELNESQVRYSTVLKERDDLLSVVALLEACSKEIERMRGLLRDEEESNATAQAALQQSRTERERERLVLHGKLREMQAEEERLLRLNAELGGMIEQWHRALPCTCGSGGDPGYEGPQEDCEQHGRSRAELIAQRDAHRSAVGRIVKSAASRGSATVVKDWQTGMVIREYEVLRDADLAHPFDSEESIDDDICWCGKPEDAIVHTVVGAQKLAFQDDEPVHLGGGWKALWIGKAGEFEGFDVSGRKSNGNPPDAESKPGGGRKARPLPEGAHAFVEKGNGGKASCSICAYPKYINDETEERHPMHPEPWRLVM